MRQLLCLAILSAFMSLAACKSEGSRSEAMAQFIDDYFQAFFEWNPSSATSVGFHQYDDKIEDYSASAFQKRSETLKQLQARLAALPSQRTPDDAIDIEILDGQIRAELLDLETLQTWRHNPMNY